MVLRVVIVDNLLCSMVYNFGPVCLYVCQTVTFESLDVGSSYLHIRYIYREYQSSLYMVKVTGAKKV